MKKIASLCASHNFAYSACQKLFHHDFPRHATQLHEIHTLRQFNGFLSIDFLGQNGLAEGVCVGEDACAFNSHTVFGRVGIDSERIPIILIKAENVGGEVGEGKLFKALAIVEHGGDDGIASIELVHAAGVVCDTRVDLVNHSEFFGVGVVFADLEIGQCA